MFFDRTASAARLLSGGAGAAALSRKGSGSCRLGLAGHSLTALRKGGEACLLVGKKIISVNASVRRRNVNSCEHTSDYETLLGKILF